MATLSVVDGATIVALVSVVVAGTTSIAAPIIAGRNQRRSDAARFKHERALKDTDELRQMIDEIAVAIPETTQEQGTLRSKHNTSGSTDANDYAAEVGAFTDARQNLIFMHTRLILRLGREHAVTIACGEAIEAIDAGGIDALLLITGLDQPRPDDWRERSMKERKAMHAAHQHFLDVASDFVSAPIRSVT